MKTELPIMMSDPMVQRILSRQKTRTRRCRELQQINQAPEQWRVVAQPQLFRDAWRVIVENQDSQRLMIRSPYGGPGTKLWVRETWAASFDTDGAMTKPYFYRASYDGLRTSSFDPRPTERGNVVGNTGWRSPLLMPRDISRILLDVEQVWLVRLHDITEEQAQQEGVGQPQRVNWPVHETGKLFYLWPASVPGAPAGGEAMFERAVDWFGWVWNTINGKKKKGLDLSWKANPWVWDIQYRLSRERHGTISPDPPGAHDAEGSQSPDQPVTGGTAGV